jgi:Glucodextranase, domain B/Carboxypeptidase regulatory-like domain
LDSTGIGSVIVDGEQVPVVDNEFTTEVELLQEGPTTISVEAVDLAGNSIEVLREVVRFSLPEVMITSPDDLAIVAATTLPVAGTVSGDVVAVAVNGVEATLTGTGFAAYGIPLIEGGNTVTATATNAAGHVATATIHVVRDLTPPRVTIHRPLDGSRTHESTISVSGLVNDVVPGTVNSSEATVTVNGIPAEVVNRSFLAAAVPLAPGANEVVTQGVDAVGNVGEDRITVILDDSPAPEVRVVSGNHQQGVIGTELPEPLIVELLDAGGEPVGGTPVVFRLRGNDGSLDGGKRQMAVVSDVAGRAQTTFSLGSRAGVGNQVVEASAVGLRDPAIFLASALPGEPALIVVDSGGQQVGVAGQQVPRPLIAAVVDSGNNRLQGVPVRFQVAQGQGHFADGSQEAVVATDSDGRAIVSYLLDSAEGIGNNNVNAAIVGLEDVSSASFIASSRAAGDPAATSISGVVLDNTNIPIAGATLRIRETDLTAVTDEEGRFRIEGAPVGAVQLIVDGSTVARPGAWPDLEFNLVTIAGRDNTVNMPIFLLPLDLDNAIYVDETHGGILTLPQIPGFSLEVAPGSVTFGGGGKSGLLSVTVVHNDKVPMVPNFGQQPSLIVTIQPAGARFEPPARLILPNVDGLPAGQVTEMYSFDHDLGHFVSIGSATVSDDATVVMSDPGVGILKAGWHCGGKPKKGVCLHECPTCQKCDDPPCECVPEHLCESCEPEGNACDGEEHCKTGRQLIPKICDGLGQTEKNLRYLDCSADPDLEGIEGLCGVVLSIEYEEVTHSCDSVDLKGARWHEEVSSDDGCGVGPIDTNSTNVLPKNRLAPAGAEFRDHYTLCKPMEILPPNIACDEVYTQKIFLDDCLIAMHTVTFTLSRIVNDDGSEECLADGIRN